MGIQLICISHKTAPTGIRELFSFREEQAVEILAQLTATEAISEAVLLTTCNRTELYCSGEKEKKIFEMMQEVLLIEAGAKDVPGISDYLLRYQDKKAVHHLFMVTAGLDSMVLGEDQILGQVKQAFATAQEAGTCKSTFQTLFRMAVTGAKKVKTDTMLSKIPVSTASLALKQAEKEFSTLSGKRLLVLGASGNIGSIVLKDAYAIEGLEIYATVRHRLPKHIDGLETGRVQVIPYEKRYQYLEKMDVVISATSSPHYTITKNHYRELCQKTKKRVFFDLAVPFDIESSIGEEDGVVLYTMEDMEQIARENNEKKQHCVSDARLILEEYEQSFYKDRLYAASRDMVKDVWEKMSAGEQDDKWQKFIFGLKEVGTAEEFEVFLRLLEKWRYEP